MADLLYKPVEAMEVLFKDQQKSKYCSEVEWRNQLFAQIVITAELCSWCSGKPALTIIDELLDKKSLQDGKENQVPSVGIQASVKDVNQTSQTGNKKAIQEKQELPLRVQAPSKNWEFVQPSLSEKKKTSHAGKGNQAYYTVGVQALTKDGEYEKPSHTRRKKSLYAKEINQALPTVQAPTKDGVYKQPSQTKKR